VRGDGRRLTGDDPASSSTTAGSHTVWREELAAERGRGHSSYFTFEPRAFRGAQAVQLRIVPGNPASAATIRAKELQPARDTIAVVGAHDA